MSNVFPAKRTLQLSKMRPNIEWWNISKGAKTPLPCWEWKCLWFEGWDRVPRRLFGRWYIPPHSCDHPWTDLGRVGTVHKRLCIVRRNHPEPPVTLSSSKLWGKRHPSKESSPMHPEELSAAATSAHCFVIPFLDVSMSYGERRDNQKRDASLNWTESGTVLAVLSCCKKPTCFHNVRLCSK